MGHRAGTLATGHRLRQLNDEMTNTALGDIDADRWKAIVEALDAPPREIPRLVRLLQVSSVFESGD
jgi:uncharacterized protein (DUF1778 family)